MYTYDRCSCLQCIVSVIIQAGSQPTFMGVFPLPPLLSFPLTSLPFPPLLSLPSIPSLFAFLLSSSPFPLEVGPPIAARGSGGALKLSQRVWAEPGRRTVFGEL